MNEVQKSPDGLRRWEEVATRLPTVLEELCTAQPLRLDERPTLPATAGVYLFTEAGKHAYVGQTRNLRRRLTQHSSSWARENQATFAFGRARAAALSSGSMRTSLTRAALASDSEFALLFAEARVAVAAMAVRFIELDDPELRTVFEVYASMILGTENTFETH